MGVAVDLLGVDPGKQALYRKKCEIGKLNDMYIDAKTYQAQKFVTRLQSQYSEVACL